MRTDGERLIPVDYRIYDKARDGETKSEHFRKLLDRACARDFTPECVLFDSWYSSLEGIKAVRFYFAAPHFTFGATEQLLNDWKMVSTTVRRDDVIWSADYGMRSLRR